MKKFISKIAVATLALCGLFLPTTVQAGAETAPTVRKHATGNLAAAATVPVSPAVATSTKGFVPQKYRSSSKVGNFDGLHRQRSYARMAMAPRAEGQNVSIPPLNGILIYASNWGYNPKAGLYSIPTTPNGEFEMLIAEPHGTGIVIDDRLYVVEHIYAPDFDLNYVRYTVYDTEEAKEIFYENYNPISDWSILPIDMDIDPVTGDVYAITYNKTYTGYQLSKMTFIDNTAESTLVAALDPAMNWNSLAFDASGQLYAISKDYEKINNEFVCVASALNKIDKATGVVTKVGDTGLCPEYPTSATIDHKSGRMFWTVCPIDDTSLLAEVDLTTGRATVLKSYDNMEEIVSLYAPEPAAADKAPAKVKNLEAVFENGALSGKVNFVAPTTLFDGTEATGALTYQVSANGQKVADGDTSFGAKVSADVTVPADGKYKFTVTVTNAAGVSPTAATTLFVGNGIPDAPYVMLSYADGKMTAKWQAVSSTSDGGYIDPEAVTYTVTRYPDETVVSTGQTALSFSEDIAVPESFTAYYYTVTANYMGRASEPGKSNVVGLGYIVPPFNETFDNEESLAGWTIIDANNDLRPWMWSSLENLRISFNQMKDMDDWAITPAIQLKQGRTYELSFDVYGDVVSEEGPEKIEVKMGKANTAAAMTTALVAPKEINTSKDAPITVTVSISPETTDAYFIGFHGISPADRYMLNIDNVKIDGGLDAGAPDMATGLTAVADPDGAYKATITFTTPDKSIAGGVIWQSLNKVEILRDDTVIKTLTSVSPAAKQTYEDVLQASGTYTYSVVCYNMFGEGRTASTSVYVGTNIPAKPAAATIVETANEGEVKVDWTPVTTDKFGKTIPASKVTYLIAEPTATGWNTLKSDLTGTSCTFRATESEQDMVQYAVFAKTEGGIGEGAYTDLIPVGPAFTSLTESFADGKVSTLWGIRTIQNGQFAVLTDEAGIPSQDGDNGFLVMSGAAIDDCAAIYSGKIAIKDMENPHLSFYTFNVAANNVNTIEVAVKEVGANAFTPLTTVKINDICEPDQWGKVVVPLKDYIGKTIMVQFTCTIKIYPVVLIDNILISSMKKHDLALTAISVPDKCVTGRPYTVAVTVSNEGSEEVDAFTVNLMVDEEKVDSKQCEAIKAGKTMNVTFDRYMHALATDAYEYSAEVVYAADEDVENNTSDFKEITPVASKLPVPESLTVQAADNGMALSWKAPDFAKIVPEAETVDMEEATSFAHELEGWTFVDVDNSALGGFDDLDGNDIQIPNINKGFSTGSFFVFDSSYPQFDKSFAAYSGTKYLAALFRADDGVTDDWAISPELSGEEQTISFVAKSLSATYPEQVQVLYSTGSMAISDFISLAPLTKVPSEWAELSIKLPKGAKRFAIRSSAEASMMLMIDDITYTPSVASKDYNITGYNVYRLGDKINDTPTSETSYADATGTAEHTYVVTAIYDKKGESGSSNAANMNSGLGNLATNLSVTATKGAIVVSGAGNAPVAIHTVDGMTVFTGCGDATIPVEQGIYLVSVGKTVLKVIVK